MTRTADSVAVRARIYGTVQGVWFRGWTEVEANSLGLFGWVRNRKDGSVETLLIGKKATVDEMVRRLGDGPPAAEVDRIETEDAVGVAPKRFEVKPTV